MIKLEELKSNNYYQLPFGDYCLVRSKNNHNDTEILKELIYQSVIQGGQEFNEINKQLIEAIMEVFHFHIYKKEPANTRTHEILSFKIIVNIDEEPYFKMIEKAAKDFQAKVEYGSISTDIIKDFKLAISNDKQEMNFNLFLDKYISKENISLEIRHEKIKFNTYEDCVDILIEYCSVILGSKYIAKRIRFIGNQMKPIPVNYIDKKNGKQIFSLACIPQEENKYGLYVACKGGTEYLFTFDLNDENKINHITIIKNFMVKNYNFIDDESEPLF